MARLVFALIVASCARAAGLRLPAVSRRMVLPIIGATLAPPLSSFAADEVDDFKSRQSLAEMRSGAREAKEGAKQAAAAAQSTLSFQELLANSIKQAEAATGGMSLSDAEIAALAVQVRQFYPNAK